MKKIFAFTVAILLITQAAYAANFNFTVPDQKLNRVKAAMKGLYPIPQIPDPAWVDPGDGSSPPMINKFTDGAWVKKLIRKWVITQVARYEQKVARQAVSFNLDDTLIQ